MTVARILDEKGRDVFTTQPHRTLKEVIELLAEKGVGAVVVSDASLTFWASFRNATSSASWPNMALPRSMIPCRVT